MDYTVLAKQLMQSMQLVGRAKNQRVIQGGLHGEGFVLHCIKERLEGITPGEISERMCISGARVAATLNSLERKGWITREIDSSDRRKIIIKITEEGIRVDIEMERKHVQMVTQMLAALGEDDAVEYVRIMGKIADLMTEFTIN